jgi:hypothetical protein
MNLLEQLREALEENAFDWEWLCQEGVASPLDLISPRRIMVQAIHRQTGLKTIPIEVNGSACADIKELAKFVCQVLMVDSVAIVEKKALLVEN